MNYKINPKKLKLSHKTRAVCMCIYIQQAQYVIIYKAFIKNIV